MTGPTVIFDETRHTYTVGGYIVGGTHKLMRAHGLLDSMPDAPAAMEKGTNYHAAIHYYLEGDLDEATCNDDQLAVCRAAEACLASLGLSRRAVRLESLAGSTLYWYATKSDAVAIDGETLINWKTGLEWPHYPIQLHLEALLLSKPPKRILAAYLSAGDRHPYEIKDYTRDFESARTAQAIATANGAAFGWLIARGLAKQEGAA